MKKIFKHFVICSLLFTVFYFTGCIIVVPDDEDNVKSYAKIEDVRWGSSYDEIEVYFSQAWTDSSSSNWDFNVYVFDRSLYSDYLQDFTYDIVGSNDPDGTDKYPVLNWVEGQNYCRVQLKESVPQGYMVLVTALANSGLHGSDSLIR